MANEQRTDLISRKALIAEYDRVHIGPPGGARKLMEDAPGVDAVEVVHGYEVGDICFYGFHDGNKSLALVEIVKILSDERGVAEVKFLKVFVDNTGNGFFNYLLRSGNTMNASFQYLKNITPVDAKMDGGNEGV